MIDEATRREVARRAGNLCEYCRCPADFSPGPFSIEHIKPRVLGGPDSLFNLAWACMGCNGHKAATLTADDPISGQLVSLFNPREHVWQEHFTWSNDAQLIIGLTATGRATIMRLDLNRSPVVNLRRVLYEAELHPPRNQAPPDKQPE